MGKGSKRRPADIGEDELQLNFDRIFRSEQPADDAPKSPIMYEAVLWIGNGGSWTQPGHKTPEEAFFAAMNAAHDHGNRDDLRVEVQDGNGNTISGFEETPVSVWLAKMGLDWLAQEATPSDG